MARLFLRRLINLCINARRLCVYRGVGVDMLNFEYAADLWREYGWTLQSSRRKVHGFGRRPASGEEGSQGSTISSPKERAGVHGD